MDATIRVAELPASRGASWLAEGFRMFRAAPLAWMSLCAGWIAITFTLLLLPLIGGVIANFLQPVFFASFAITAFRQSAGEKLAMGDLFHGFKRHLRSLVNLGALLLLAEIAIFALMALMGLPLGAASGERFTLQEYVEALQGREWILMVGFAMTAAVKGALWFAPQLIAFHGMSTLHAIRWSVYAALANLGTMVVYGASLMLLFFVGLVPWALGLVVVVPVMVISTYVGYREVFETQPAAATPP